MKNRKTITIFEAVLLIGLFGQIILRWNVSKVTLGDFFCLELLAVMFYYRYDEFKNK